MKVSETGDVPETPALSPLEEAVLAAALGEAGPLLDQARQAEVVSRTYSGVGFMTRFRVPADAPGAPADARPAVVNGQHPALSGGAEFLLELRDGRLHTLEAFCFDGMWPGDEAGFELSLRA